MDYICRKDINRKHMSFEAVSILGVIIISWIFLLMLDAIVSGISILIFDVRFTKVFMWGLISLAIPPAAIAYGSLIGRNIYTINKIELSFDNLPESFDGYRIVHISDIHARSFENRTESLAKAVEKINSLDADLIAFTGDLITMAPEEIDVISGELSSMKAKDGILSVIGNHDYGIYAPKGSVTDMPAIELLVDKEISLGWNPLINESRIIRRGCDSIAVVGVENTSPSVHFPSKGDLMKAEEGTDSLFRILLTHDPLHWEAEVTGKGYPLTLSGHTHAMQLSLFGWSPSRYIFKQYRGLYKTEGQYLYVNVGLGETILPARIGASPEITLITLKRS